MDRLCIKTLVVGPIQTNCYIVYHEDTKQCIVIDPGFEPDRIYGDVLKMGLDCQGIYLTHGHFDHITGAQELASLLKTKIHISRAECELARDPSMNGSLMFGHSAVVKADVCLEDGQEVDVLDHRMRCILTPGHTIGGMCFYFPQDLILFSGDTLFQESVGRTDFPTGSHRQLMESVRDLLARIPESVRVYPGHGPMTTIQDERMFNPFAG